MISTCNTSENTSLAMRNTTKKRGADFMSHAKIDDKSGEIFISEHKKSYQTHTDVAAMNLFGEHAHITDISRMNSHYARFINVSECIPKKNIIETHDKQYQRQDQEYEKLLDCAAMAAESSKVLNESLHAKLLEEAKKNATLELKIFNTLKAMKEIQSMAANTAHDLKSPLNTLMLGIPYFSCHYAYHILPHTVLYCTDLYFRLTGIISSRSYLYIFCTHRFRSNTHK